MWNIIIELLIYCVISAFYGLSVAMAAKYLYLHQTDTAAEPIVAIMCAAVAIASILFLHLYSTKNNPRP